MQTLGRELVKRGHRVTTVGMYLQPENSREDDQGVRVIRLSRSRVPLVRAFGNRARLARELRRIHKSNHIDIVEGGEMEVAMLNRRLRGARIVLRMHGGPAFLATGNQVEMLKERWAYRIAHEVCACGHNVAEGTRRSLRLGDRPVEVIWNPVDIHAFSPGPPEAEEEGLIIYVGTVRERKGIRQLIQAIPLIFAAAPNARLEVYGSEDPVPPGGEPLIPNLMRLIPPELATRIQWKGRVARSELPAVLRRASVCVYPSHIESMPLAWLEALATGKAIVASETGPGPEIIDVGTNGLLCNPHEPKSIAENVIRLLNDPVLRRRLGATARNLAVERYALDKIIEQNLRYYARVGAAPR